MEYNTETINHAAQQLAEMFKSAVILQRQSGESEPLIAQIEADVREVLRQIGVKPWGCS